MGHHSSNDAQTPQSPNHRQSHFRIVQFVCVIEIQKWSAKEFWSGGCKMVYLVTSFTISRDVLCIEDLAEHVRLWA